MEKTNKFMIYTAIAGVAAGLVFAGFGVMLGFAFLAAVLIAGIVLLDYRSACYILACYGVIDFVMRNYITAFATVWDELLLVAMTCLWLWKWLTAREKEHIRISPVDCPIAVFIAVMTIVLIVNSPDFSISVEGFRAIVQYMLWYFVVLQLADDEKSIKNVCLVLIFVGGIMGLHGVYQYVTGAEMPAGWVDQNEAGVRTRVYSILTSPNIMGSLMTLISPVCVAFALTAKNNVQRLVFGIFAFAMLISLVFTFSRGAWIGFAAAVMVYVFVKDIRLVIPCIILAIIVVVFVPSVGNRISYMLSPEYIESSLKGGRLIRWIKGYKILSQNPVFGVGLGHFGGAVAINHKLQYLVDLTMENSFYMDNYYLKTAVESGLVGFFAFLFLMYSVFINGTRTIIKATGREREILTGILSGLTGVMVHNWVENVFEVPMITSIFWLMAGIMMSYWCILDKRERVE